MVSTPLPLKRRDLKILDYKGGNGSRIFEKEPLMF